MKPQKQHTTIIARDEDIRPGEAYVAYKISYSEPLGETDMTRLRSQEGMGGLLKVLPLAGNGFVKIFYFPASWSNITGTISERTEIVVTESI